MLQYSGEDGYLYYMGSDNIDDWDGRMNLGICCCNRIVRLRAVHDASIFVTHLSLYSSMNFLLWIYPLFVVW